MPKYEELGKLLYHIGRLHAVRADQYMDGIGLYRGQGMLLKFIARHEGMTHSDIANKLHISPAAVTKVIKRMEEQGYLKRKPDPRDERISRVFLQLDGKKVVEDIDNKFHQLDQVTFKGFTGPELETLRSFLTRMQINLQEDCPGSDHEMDGASNS